MYNYIPKEWQVQKPDRKLKDEISRELKISKITAGILINRGILSVKEAGLFLNSNLFSLYDPFLIPGMEKGITRIKKALRMKEKILVYGDRDVDGATAVVIMLDALRELNGDCLYFIPSEEGYGLHNEIIGRYKAEGVSLIITVDCGIRGVQQIAYAKKLGIDTVVTDHHEPPEKLPEAVALINPKRKESKYPFFDIAGCTVAFKTCQALYERMFPEQSRNKKLFFIQQYLDLITLGSIADVVPLTGENRVLVREGLPALMQTRRIGLQLLLKRCKVSSGLTAKKLSWNVIPVLNAGSRMGKTGLSCKLLLTDSKDEAEKLLDEIERLNKERKLKQARSFSVISSIIHEQCNLKEDRILVVVSQEAEIEVAGVIASHISQQYNRPVIILIVGEKDIVGSARSIECFDIVEALESCSDLLIKYGGHKFAAGLSIDKANIEEFRKRIKRLAESKITEDDLVPRIPVDEEIEFHRITDGLVKEMECLEPFGAGNAGPMFVLYNSELVRHSTAGANGNHLRIKLGNGGFDKYLEGIGWGLGILGKELEKVNKVDLIFRPELNFWQGKQYLQLLLEDIRPSSQGISD